LLCAIEDQVLADNAEGRALAVTADKLTTRTKQNLDLEVVELEGIVASRSVPPRRPGPSKEDLRPIVPPV
jgi:hypothetical protein